MRFMVAASRLVCGLLAGGSAGAQDYESFVREKPPCHSAPLTNQQIIAAAKKELGESFFRPSGMPDRPFRISERGCVYEVEYVILSVKNQWLSFDAIDGTSWILVARDLSVFRPLIHYPAPKAVGSPKNDSIG
jgi:hypothetical protein